MLGKVIKCGLSLSHGNADNERSLSINKNTLSKERSLLSITTLNGLRAAEDGIRNGGGLENIVVGKDIISSVKSSHKVYLAHLDAERKKEYSRKRKRGQASEKQEESELKKKREDDLKKIESLRKSNKELLARESEAEEMLKSACTFLEEGNERMTKGLADKSMDEIEAAQKIIQLAHEKQKKAKEELEIVHKEKRKLTDELEEKAVKKIKSK